MKLQLVTVSRNRNGFEVASVLNNERVSRQYIGYTSWHEVARMFTRELGIYFEGMVHYVYNH